MTFYNHCTEELSNEAKRIIGNRKSWHPTYKDQLLSRVEDMLEVGSMMRTKTGFKSVPFNLSDVESIVTIVSDRDDAAV
jgi:hypothetical protein